MSTAGNVLIGLAAGWYLMLPPYGEPDPPLKRWEIVEAFDSATSCEVARQTRSIELFRLVAELQREHPNATGPVKDLIDGVRQQRDRFSLWAKCIATDDPRLR